MMQSLSRNVEGRGQASQDREPATCHRLRRRGVIDMATSSRQLQASNIHELQRLYEAQETAIHKLKMHLNKLGRAAARAEGRQEFINHLQMVIELHNLADLHFQRGSRAFSAALYWHPLLAEAVGEEVEGIDKVQEEDEVEDEDEDEEDGEDSDEMEPCTEKPSEHADVDEDDVEDEEDDDDREDMEEEDEQVEDKDKEEGKACDGCASKSDGALMLLCDTRRCKHACHTYCCDLPLQEVPLGPWHCHRCTCETKGNKGVRRVHRISPGGPSLSGMLF